MAGKLGCIDRLRVRAVLPTASITQRRIRSTGCEKKAQPKLRFVPPAKQCLQQWHQQQGDDVDDLDQGIDCRTGSILVRIADGIAGDSSLVGL